MLLFYKYFNDPDINTITISWFLPKTYMYSEWLLKHSYVYDENETTKEILVGSKMMLTFSSRAPLPLSLTFMTFVIKPQIYVKFCLKTEITLFLGKMPKINDNTVETWLLRWESIYLLILAIPRRFSAWERHSYFAKRTYELWFFSRSCRCFPFWSNYNYKINGLTLRKEAAIECQPIKKCLLKMYCLQGFLP